MSFRRVWNTITGGRLQREIDRELAFHVEERVDELVAQGLSVADARRQARVQLGNRTLFAERIRDVDVWMRLDARFRDVRHATRGLAHAPGFAATVVLTLAIGIGANTAVFSALDAVLLRPLPFPNADRLVQIRQVQERSAESHIAPIRLEDWNRMTSTFAAISGYYMENVSDTSGAIPERVRRAFVAPRFLEVWGVAPALGRAFNDADYRGSGMPVVIVSDRYWRTRMSGDANALGRMVRIGATAFPVVGIMPAGFLFPDRDVDLWFPVGLDNQYARSRLATWYVGIGRLNAGVSVAEARANLAIVQSQLGRQFPDTDSNLTADVQPLKDVTIGGVRRSVWIVFMAVSVLLLITCTNIAALLLSRAVHRQHEMSVRLSLGASRAAIAGHVLTETTLLAIAGAAAGLLVAAGAIDLFRGSAAQLPRMDEIVINARILMYALIVTLGVAVFCGLVPALRAGRGGSLNSSARTVVSSRISLHWLLVGAQVTLAVTLLAGAGLLVRSFHELFQVNRGFDAHGVLTFRVSGNFSETADYARLRARIDGTLERMRAIPGVSAAATSLFAPGVPAEFETMFTLAEAQDDPGRRLIADLRVVSAEYFTTMAIPVVEGEACRRQSADGPAEFMVNRSFAARYLSNRPSVLGLHLITAASRSTPGRIVGVVADARERGLDRLPGPTVYPCQSAPNPTPLFLLRTRADPSDLAAQVRLAVRQQDPLRSVYDMLPLERRIDDAFAQNRIRTGLLAFFAGTALTLARVGLYGTMSYAVSLRRREMGLRLALGATRSGVVRQLVLGAIRGVTAATGLGVILSLGFTRLLSGLLFGVSPSDPFVLTSVVLLVFGVATLAALLPALRASRVTPVIALRDV